MYTSWPLGAGIESIRGADVVKEGTKALLWEWVWYDVGAGKGADFLFGLAFKEFAGGSPAGVSIDVLNLGTGERSNIEGGACKSKS